jgi:lysophospholipase L1-like esterase
MIVKLLNIIILKKEREKKEILLSLLLISITYNINLYNKKNKVDVKIEYRNDENIVFYGDSITNKYEIENFFPANKIINSGISGDEASDLIERIENDVYKYNPSKVFILIGINDLNHNVDKEEILNNIQEIITGIKINRKYTKIYVESIYPINKDYMDEKGYGFNEELDNDDIIEFNKKIEELCNKNNITYIDVYDSLLDEEGNLNKEYSKEGLHLNDVGYLKVSETLSEYIKEK